MLTSCFCLSHTMSDSVATKKSKKKGGGVVKLIQNLIKRRDKSANELASQSTLAQVSAVSQDSVSGNVVESVEPADSSKYI